MAAELAEVLRLDASSESPPLCVRREPTGMPRVYVVATRGLRPLVRTLYLFPILVVTKIVLYEMRVPEGDLVTVAFVVLVVLLFAMLAVVLLLIAILGPKSQRSDNVTLAFSPPRKAAFERIIREAIPNVAVRLTGHIDAGLEPGAVVIEDRWGRDMGKLVRFVEGSSFVVMPERDAPVVVELQTCPLLLGRYDKLEQLAIPGTGAIEPLGRFVLRQGDLVEVIAADTRPGTHPVLQSAAGITPYREAESALVATSTKKHTVIVRALGECLQKAQD